MNEPENLPLEWRDQPFFEASIFWMARQPLDNRKLLDRSELAQERAELHQELEDPELDDEERAEVLEALEELELDVAEFSELAESLPPPREIIPGWYFQVRVTFGEAQPTLEAARQLIRDRLRGWNLRPLALFFDTPQDAPVWLGKSERKKLLSEFDAIALLEQPEGEERCHLRFYKPLSESAALGVEILDISHPTEFETVIGAPNDPLRSLVGRTGTLSVLEHPDDEEGDWKPLSDGAVSLEGSSLRVGTLQLELTPGEAIEGVAFESAFWLERSTGKRFDVSLEPGEVGQEPRASQALERSGEDTP